MGPCRNASGSSAESRGRPSGRPYPGRALFSARSRGLRRASPSSAGVCGDPPGPHASSLETIEAELPWSHGLNADAGPMESRCTAAPGKGVGCASETPCPSPAGCSHHPRTADTLPRVVTPLMPHVTKHATCKLSLSNSKKGPPQTVPGALKRSGSTWYTGRSLQKEIPE